jgi:protein-S-isoprenylcysteine O-methyltransferase Ste14
VAVCGNRAKARRYYHRARKKTKPGAAMVGLTEKAFIGLLALFLVIAALLFGGAGTFDYWQAWVFLAVYFSASFALTLYLVKWDPALLGRRMRGGPWAEKRPAQRVIMPFASLAFVGLTLLPALDRRFGWSHIPPAMALAGDLLVALGWLGIFFVFRENSFTSATIELAPDQKVITTGPYAFVRHPMYASAMIMLLGTPIALGSWWGVLALVVMSPALVWRLLDEERFLGVNLPGYESYKETVRYRLIPHVW